jgi:hypothetical protein
MGFIARLVTFFRRPLSQLDTRTTTALVDGFERCGSQRQPGLIIGVESAAAAPQLLFDQTNGATTTLLLD